MAGLVEVMVVPFAELSESAVEVDGQADVAPVVFVVLDDVVAADVSLVLGRDRKYVGTVVFEKLLIGIAAVVVVGVVAVAVAPVAFVAVVVLSVVVALVVVVVVVVVVVLANVEQPLQLLVALVHVYVLDLAGRDASYSTHSGPVHSPLDLRSYHLQPNLSPANRKKNNKAPK